MPGRKKQTSRVLILTTVLLSLFTGTILTQSSVNPDDITKHRKSMPDIIVADGASQQAFSAEADAKDTKAPKVTVQKTDANDEVPENTPQGDWILTGGEWYYQINDAYKTGWLYEDNKWYYFDQTGVMQVGWVESQKRWFFMNEDGIMQTGWIQSNGKWYHMNEEGIMQTGWLEKEGKWYYLGEDGDMKLGWLQLGDKWYYLNANGTMATGWIVDKGKRYFLQDNGVWDPAAATNADAIPDAPQGAMIALTFDDGPGMYTDRLLNVLEATGAKATFFMLGENIPQYSSAVKRMEALGCELANHTLHHQDLTTLDAAQIQGEIGSVNETLTSIVGHGASLLRPPYGAVNDNVASAAKEPMILWSIDTRDWETLDIQATVEAVFTTVENGDIVLMHDIHETTVAAAEIIIPALVEKGYQLVTVSELAAANEITLEAGKTYRSMTASS